MSIHLSRQRKTERREHDTPQRARFKALVDEGHSQRNAASQIGVSRPTAQQWLRTSGRRTCRPGRPPILGDKEKDKIKSL